MHIKQHLLLQQVQKNCAPLYLLTGQDNYLLEDSLSTIKAAIKKTHHCDEKTLSILSPDDWYTVKEEANTYPLFSQSMLLTVLFDKKSIEAPGKKVLTEYLDSINERCFIIIKAPNLPTKQVQWLSSHHHAVLTVAYPLNPQAMKNWIGIQLQKHSFKFDSQVPQLIHQYTQGNMQASAQVIKKIALSYTPNSFIERQQVQEHLSDQCNYTLFELVDACLLGHSDQAIQILRHAAHNKTEPTLVLWILCQEIRLIMQLSQLIDQKIDSSSACNRLKIRPQQINLYMTCSHRFNKTRLQRLHQYCCFIDNQIKSNVGPHVWNSLENTALSLCCGKLIGTLCTP